MLNVRLLRIALAAAILFFTQSLRAEDNVLSTVKEAVRQYQNGDYTAAASNLDYAAQLVRQKKSETMKGLLPAPPPGWQAGEASAQALGAAVLGGGLTVSRDYTRADAFINIEIVSDSPVLDSLLMMTNNAVFAGAGGGKLETVKGYKAIIKYDADKKGGEIYIVVASRFVVSIKGRQVTRNEMTHFATLMDYTVLEKN